MEKVFFTEKELAERWCLTPKTLRDWRVRKGGNYPRFIKLSGAVRYPVAEVERYEREAFERNALPTNDQVTS